MFDKTIRNAQAHDLRQIAVLAEERDDSFSHPAAEKFDEITFDEVYRRNLKVMDMTAFTLCRENGLRVIVFDMDTPGNLEKVLAGEKIGTLVKL